MRIQTDNYRFGNTLDELKTALLQLLPLLARQTNNVSEGRITGYHNALTAAPTTGIWAQGDFVRNLTPAVLGAGGSQYVITGWVCVAGGEPGTWAACRSLTGT